MEWKNKVPIIKLLPLIEKLEESASLHIYSIRRKICGECSQADPPVSSPIPVIWYKQAVLL